MKEIQNAISPSGLSYSIIAIKIFFNRLRYKKLKIRRKENEIDRKKLMRSSLLGYDSNPSLSLGEDIQLIFVLYNDPLKVRRNHIFSILTYLFS